MNKEPALWNLSRTLPFAALLALAVAGCGRSEQHREASAPPKVVQAKLLTVGESEVANQYMATGAVTASLNASLSSKVMGRVVSVLVQEGDFVKKGQLLVTIDSRELQAATNVASANYHAAVIGVGSAKKAVEIEEKTRRASVAQAESEVQQAQAALAAARARLDLVKAGPRTQEVSQSHIAVTQAESSLKLAKTELDRIAGLVREGALAQRDLDLAQNRYDLARGQYEAALQNESIAREGSRSQEIRGAEQAVAQAEATLKQAKSGLAQAKAAALQVDLRKKDVDVAKAQVQQSSAAVNSARVSLSYCRVEAPFDGRITLRSVDPGAMASAGVPLLSIEGGEFQLEATVPEKYISTITIGSEAPIRIEALSKQPVEGRVKEILPQGDAMSHTFLVKYRLDGATGLKSGMFGRAAVKTGSSSAIEVPTSATWEREGLHYVFAVNQEGIVRLRIVTLGEPVGDTVEVLSGLNRGDKIVIGDRAHIADGNKVEGV